MNFQKYENLGFLAEEAGFACIATPWKGVRARYELPNFILDNCLPCLPVPVFFNNGHYFLSTSEPGQGINWMQVILIMITTK
jgi:hypothetical protein